MSARVLNPTVMSEISRSVGGARVAPSRAALARVRRDLFGPVDHAAARALAETELRAQSLLDAERWGFDFRLEMPRENSRYEWRIIGPQEIVPEPYALRGMSYIRKHSPTTPMKKERDEVTTTAKTTTTQSDEEVTEVEEKKKKTVNTLASIFLTNNQQITPPPPPQTRLKLKQQQQNKQDRSIGQSICVAKSTIRLRNCETTPIVGKQTTITDFMKSRKRTLNGTSKKSIMEPAEKVSRSAAKIHS